MRRVGAQFSCGGFPEVIGSTWRAEELSRYVGTATFAGFEGVEFGPVPGQLPDPHVIEAILARSGIALSSVTFTAAWRNASESDDERAVADDWIAFMKSFPGARIVLEQTPGVDRRDLRGRQRNAISCIKAIGRRAQNAGVEVTFRPDSAAGSVFRDAEDYDLLLNRLADAPVGYTPDLSQITQGGMDALDVIHTYRDRVDHVRLSAAVDPDPEQLRTGNPEHARVVAYLCHTGFTGWFVLGRWDARESTSSDKDIQSAGRDVKDHLAPLVEEAHRARVEEASRNPNPGSPVDPEHH